MNFELLIRRNSEKIPVRAHLHRTGITAYGNTDEEIKRFAPEYLEEAIMSKEFNSLVEKHRLEYALAQMWADGNQRIIDFFGFGDLRGNWKGNPEVNSWDFRNGIFTKGAITCGDGLIMLGREEEYRRTTHNIQTYMDSSDKIYDFFPLG
ncbi:hypothetical protein HY449_00175 [Candidatus Pacearchaeota archaeon]|nr:hypothetical protein [Candidatus Pacearchaeota archaeon]